MPRDQWIIKNQKQKYFIIGDLPKLPTLYPDKVIDLLNYYGQDEISNSSDLTSLLNLGWVTLNKISGQDHDKIATSDAEDAISSAEENETGRMDFSEVSSSPYLAGSNSETVLYVDCSSNPVQINLPPARNNQNVFFNIKKLDNTGNILTIKPNGSETIDGESTLLINTQYTAATIHCDGANWFII